MPVRLGPSCVTAYPRDSQSRVFYFSLPTFYFLVSNLPHMRRQIVLLSAALMFAATGPTAWAGAEGSVITWGSPTNISGDSDVSTVGSLVAAFNMNGPEVTVNGVTFAAFPVTGGTNTATSGNFTFTETPGDLVPRTGLGSASPPFSNLSANYQTPLSSAISTDDNNTLVLHISGLIVGQTYQFQWWLNASTNFAVGFNTTATSPNSVTLDANTTDTNGGLGQYVIGTFFCGDTNQFITFTGIDANNAPTVNAFELRLVPEPSTMSILLIGAAIIAPFAFRRRSYL